tara:strand:- start:13 stop:201 length:189 start_codon:yes stop_codon:yes gene_type:complete
MGTPPFHLIVSALVFVPSNPVPIAVSSVLMETFAVEKFQLFSFKLLDFVCVARKDVITIAKH